MENRNLLTGIIVALAVYFAYMFVYTKFIAPTLTPPAPIGPVSTQDSDAGLGDGSMSGTPSMTSADGTSQPAATASNYTFTAGTSIDPITIGGSDDGLRLVLSPRGAAVTDLRLTTLNPAKSKFVYRETADGNDPLHLLRPILHEGQEHYSYSTATIWFGPSGQASRALDKLIWHAERVDDRTARFSTTLQSPEGELLRVTKEYRITPTKPLADIVMRIENVGTIPHRVILNQYGPIGFPEEGRYYPTRRLVALFRAGDGTAELKTKTRADLSKGEVGLLASAADGYFVWTALTNKYFGVFTRPIDATGKTANVIGGAKGDLIAPEIDPHHDPGDYRVQIATKSAELPPKTQLEYRFQIYAGPKGTDLLSSVDPSFGERNGIGYVIAQDADITCCCTFAWLTSIMQWMLDSIYFVVRNYGIAIMIMVLIVRTVLHPLARFQQRAMYKFQESMVRVQPRLDEVKAKYKDDLAKQQQEQMKVFAENGVNPAAPMLGMLPAMLQMPILIALWQAMNTDVQLRHAVFDGWWIRDLSSPDALIMFKDEVTIPLLGWLPWIGTIFRDIPSFNVLPLVMGVSMYLQQKYMPKPQMAERRKAAEEAGSHAVNSFEEQMKQQQIVAYMMCFMFPLMFYYMPAGLNLYWLATNVFGICESLIIRRQLEEEKRQKALRGDKPEPPKPPGFFGKFMKQMTARMEELQKQADSVSREEKNQGAGQKPNQGGKRSR